MSTHALSSSPPPRGEFLYDPPPSAALRTYRRLLPLRVRKAMRSWAGVETWEQLRQQLERPAILLRRARHRRHSARLRRQGLLREGCVPVQVGEESKVAVVQDGLTPLQAREHNLRLVCDTLEGAGIEYFGVRTTANTSSAVGISSEDRARAESALAARCKEAAAYVTAPGRYGLQETPSQHGGSPGAWRRASGMRVIRVFCYLTDDSRSTVLGVGFGCDIEMWDPAENGEELTAPRRNLTCDRVSLDAPLVDVPGALLTRLASRTAAPRLATVRTRREFANPLPDDIRFPIDAVYTWVDGADPAWQRRRATVAGKPYHPEAANAARYVNRDELLYSLRSLHQYAPWIRHIYLVTDQQVPAWLQTRRPGLTVVDHREIFTDPSLLPTFNSQSIESQLHHIEGLAEHFLYFNDDVFLGRPTTPQHFFLANGVSKFFPSKALLPPVGTSCGDEVPVSAAGVTNRLLLESRFGSSITQKMKHTPCALRRSVLEEIEREFPEEHRRTAGNPFRSADDISITNSLHHYYGFHTGRAAPGDIRYDYIDISQRNIAPQLRRLLANRRNHTFCLNDTLTCDSDMHADASLVQAFLDGYFPSPGPFESRPGPTDGAFLPCPSPSHSHGTPILSETPARTHAR